MVEQKPDRRTYGKRQDGHGNIPQRRYLCTKEQTASVRLCVVQCVGNNMNVNIGGGGDQLFGESRSSEQPSASGTALPDHDFCDIGKPDIFRDLQRYILAVRHNDLGAEPLRELYVLRKPGLILIIYDRIRLHIDGGKSCMKDLSHLCGGVYDPCIGRRRG